MNALPDIVTITDLRADAAGVIKRTADSQAPVVITQHGRAAAVVVSAKAYERTQHELGDASVHRRRQPDCCGRSA